MHALISVTNLFASPLIILNLVVVYLSIWKKAFDTVNHAILLTKLIHHGIRGNVHEFFLNRIYPLESNLLLEVNIKFLGIVTLFPIPPPVVSNGPHLTVCVHLRWLVPVFSRVE